MLPRDPFILLSYLNTQLRDEYSSLEEFCRSTGESMEDIVEAMRKIGYAYDPEGNRFARGHITAR